MESPAAIKIVLKLDIDDSIQGSMALQAVASLDGVDQVSLETREGKMTVVGIGVDPVALVGKLPRLLPYAIFVSVGPAKEQPEKEAGEKKAMEIVLKLDIDDRIQGSMALEAVASLDGVDQVSLETREGKMTVVGIGVDPVALVGKLPRLLPYAIFVSVGPAKEQPEKEAGEKKG